MKPRLLLQTATLLFLGQAVLGLLGALTATAAWLPWIGLILPFLLAWLTIRTAQVFRSEMARAVKLGHAVVPWRAALFVGALWQLAGHLAALLVPGAITAVWQGVLTPPHVLLMRYWPAAEGAGRSLWLAAFLEVALFAGVAGKAAARRPQLGRPAAPATLAAASGEWAPARRRTDIAKRPRVELAPPGDE